MRWIAGVIGVATFTGATSSATAQVHPDFSGRWADTSVATPAVGGRAGGGPPAARGGGGRGRGRGGGGGGGRGSLGSGWGSDISITQGGGRMTLQYTLFGRGDMQPPIIYHFALDGAESRNRLLLGWGVEDRVSRTRWSADTLVITTTFRSPSPATGAPEIAEMTQSLVLESPTSLVVLTTRPAAMGGAATTTRTVYSRVQDAGR